jgi:hypothetical protein
MKKLLIPCMLVILSFTSSSALALGSGREFGAGIVLGEPSGVLGQFFMTRKALLDVTAAWSFDKWFMITTDYQVYNNIANAPIEWLWYYGGGAYVALPENEQGILGVRVPLGISYSFPHSFIDVWAEIDPALRLLPDTTPDLQGGIGVTLWLK